jgi:transposase
LISEVTGVDFSYCIPDVIWDRIVALIPSPSSMRRGKKNKRTGRPRMDDRMAMSAIFYVLRTGCQWKALPRSLGASSTVHDRFQEWRKQTYVDRWIVLNTIKASIRDGELKTKKILNGLHQS